MKTSLFSSILCASLLVFAVGCGKNESGGGHKGINYSQLNVSSQQLVTNLNNWYNGKIEGTLVLGVLKIDKKQVTSNDNQNCDSVDVFGLFDLPYCTYNYSSNSNTGTVISTQTLNVVANDNIAVKNRNNTELNSIFNGTAGQIMQATSVGAQAVRVDVLKNNVVTSYIIDMSYHSLLNPVVKITNSQSPVTISTYATCAFPGTCQGI